MLRTRIQHELPAPADDDRGESSVLTSWVLIFLGLHVPLALVMRTYPFISQAHALVVVVLAVRWAWTGNVLGAAAAAAYITGAEVLWRMTGGSIVWELGKYAVTLVLGMAIVQTRRRSGPWPIIAYFGLLLPSALLTLTNEGFGVARQQISFNLSGPLALAVCVWFFSTVKLRAIEFHRVLLTLVAPVVGVATVALYGILTNPDITFTTESNRELSGGFGPNQVAAMLGLGGLLTFWCLVEARATTPLKVALLGLSGALMTQSAMTYSRQGIYTAAAAVVCGGWYWMRDRRSRLTLVGAAVTLLLVGQLYLLPRLEAFTQGTLSQRFGSADLTSRDAIGAAELARWRSNPLFGVGPGRSRVESGIAAHTEFTRLLAEHGLLGAGALLMLVMLGGTNLRQARSVQGKAIVAAFLSWTLVYTLGAAMRLVAPSFVFGLACASVAYGRETGVITSTPAMASVRRPTWGEPPVRSTWGEPPVRSTWGETRIPDEVADAG